MTHRGAIMGQKCGAGTIAKNPDLFFRVGQLSPQKSAKRSLTGAASTMLHVLAYDIADPARLRRIARLMERRALRTQKSVFLFEGTAAEAEALLDEAAALLDLREDIVQAWPLPAAVPPLGSVRGVALPYRPAAVVAQRGRPVVCPEP
jgi:CRISPR-associated protein Cas2